MSDVRGRTAVQRAARWGTMSAHEDTIVDAVALPTFDLDYGYDDPDDPTSVTVYAPNADDVCTTWITIDVHHAVPLEDVA